jgi:hypothetical protein
MGIENFVKNTLISLFIGDGEYECIARNGEILRKTKDGKLEHTQYVNGVKTITIYVKK